MRIKSSGFGDFTVLAQFSSFRARNLKRCVRIEIHEVIFLEIHVVRPGDTLYSIGQRHGVAPGLIARYNGLRGKDPRINRVMKWLFYLYYPLHLAILGTIQYLR